MSSREGFFISYFFLLFLLFQDGGPHENDCTTSGNDATAITGDDAIFCDRFSHFLSLASDGKTIDLRWPPISQHCARSKKNN